MTREELLQAGFWRLVPGAKPFHHGGARWVAVWHDRLDMRAWLNLGEDVVYVDFRQPGLGLPV
jgi:hypothetical protein